MHWRRASYKLVSPMRLSFAEKTPAVMSGDLAYPWVSALCVLLANMLCEMVLGLDEQGRADSNGRAGRKLLHAEILRERRKLSRTWVYRSDNGCRATAMDDNFASWRASENCTLSVFASGHHHEASMSSRLFNVEAGVCH